MSFYLIYLLIVLSNPIQEIVYADDQEESIAAIDSIVQEFHEKGAFNGVILIAKGDTVLYTGLYGKSNFEWEIPHSLDSKFRIASITKTFTAVLTLRLIEEGYLCFDDVITDHLEDYPPKTGNRITIKHLLTQTSGIPDYISLPGFKESKAFLQHERESFPEYFKNMELIFEPGSDWDYGNSEYYLLGLIIEQVTGMCYQGAIDLYILKPAGLHQTGFVTESKVISKYSGGYIRDETGLKTAPSIHSSVCFSAGMMYSTASDLHRFVRALYKEGQLLSPQKIDLMTTQQNADYGLGVFVGSQIIGGIKCSVLLHMGEIFGYSSQVSYFPENDYTLIILDNTQQCPSRLYFAIMDMLPGFHLPD